METNNLPNAIKFATEKHGSQMYGKHPYIKHLNDVAKILMDARFTEDIVLTCAYLHDVLEDTDATKSEIIDQFGELVAEHVVALTNSKRNDHAGLNGVPAIVKVADRIANHNACIEDGRIDLAYKYIKDYKHIRKLHAGEALNTELTKGYKILYKMVLAHVQSILGITKQAFSQWITGETNPKYSSIEGLRAGGVDIFKYL